MNFIYVLVLSVFVWGKCESRTKKSNQCPVSVLPPDPESGCCGLEAPRTVHRIIGGMNTSIIKYPWMALLEYVKTPECETEEEEGPQIELLCGGFLISSYYVLTARHCVADKEPSSARLGEYDTRTNPDCEKVNGKKVCSPSFDSIRITNIRKPGRRHDIALLTLERAAIYSDFVRPICLPQSDILEGSFEETLWFIVAGWGTTKRTFTDISPIKRHVDVPYVPQCVINDDGANLFCAGGESGLDACKGDSGGPLMWKNGQKYEAVGIVSGGASEECGIEGSPGFYTEVFAYKTWILNSINFDL